MAKRSKTRSDDSLFSESTDIAIVSDLHAYDDLNGDTSRPSFLCSKEPPEPTHHPIAGLKSLIQSQQLHASLLICPGDLGDKARPGGIQYAWQAVNDIANLLECSQIVATTGNHDVDSRYKHCDHDPKGLLQSLDPRFPLPTATEELNDRFWSRNYAILDELPFRLVVLNSSAFHGGGTQELHHGRVSDWTVQKIKRDLDTLPQRDIGVLLCHHHPIKHSELLLGEYDEMIGGQHLLDLLGTGQYGSWIVIHGHKHHPKICFASGGSGAPIIFSAGSLSASIFNVLTTHNIRNQFYIMTLPHRLHSDFGLVGLIRTWDWSYGVGWTKGRQGNPPLAGDIGFGYRGNLPSLADKINASLSKYNQWHVLVATFPELKYLMPSDLTTLLDILERKYQIRALRDNSGYGPIVELGRRNDP